MTEIAQRNPQQELVSRVRSETFKEQVAMALPDNMPASRFVRATVTALLANPEVATADPDSLFQSLLRSAQDGLLPDGREAALVIFKTKVGPKVQYLPMIGGLRKIAAEHGWAIRTAVVYEKDEFDYELGLEPTVKHRPARAFSDRGEPVAAYAVGKHRDGRVEFDVMSAEEIEKVRQTSRAKDYGPWVEWPERMWEKTVGRRLFKKLPLGERDQERIRRVLDVDELRPGEAAEMLYGPQAAKKVAERFGPGAVAREIPEAGSQGAAASGPDGGGEPNAAVASPEEEGSPTGAEPSSSSDPEPAFTAPEGAANDDPAVLAANEAGEVEIPSGTNKGRKIRELLDDKNGLSWLRWALRNWADDTFGRACWAFAAVYAPDVHEQVADEKAKAAAS